MQKSLYWFVLTVLPAMFPNSKVPEALSPPKLRPEILPFWPPLFVLKGVLPMIEKVSSFKSRLPALCSPMKVAFELLL